MPDVGLYSTKPANWTQARWNAYLDTMSRPGSTPAPGLFTPPPTTNPPEPVTTGQTHSPTYEELIARGYSDQDARYALGQYAADPTSPFSDQAQATSTAFPVLPPAPPAPPATPQELRAAGFDFRADPGGGMSGSYTALLDRLAAIDPGQTQEQLDNAVLAYQSGAAQQPTETAQEEAYRKNALRNLAISREGQAQEDPTRRAAFAPVAERGFGVSGIATRDVSRALGLLGAKTEEQKQSAFSQALGNVIGARGAAEQARTNKMMLDLQRQQNELTEQSAAEAKAAEDAKTGFSSWGPGLTKWREEAQGRWW